MGRFRPSGSQTRSRRRRSAASPQHLDRRAATKQWAKCVELYAKIDRPDARYNAACCLALDGKKEDAFKMLDRVLADGFRDLEHLKKDTDLASLHDDPRWPKLVAAVEANVTKFEASLQGTRAAQRAARAARGRSGGAPGAHQEHE